MKLLDKGSKFQALNMPGTKGDLANYAPWPSCNRNYLEKGFMSIGEWLSHSLYRRVKILEICTDSKLFQIKMPVVFLGSEGSSARREDASTSVSC